MMPQMKNTKLTRTDMNFELCINTNIINKGDPRLPGWTNATMDAEELMAHILKGYAYSQGVLNEKASTHKPKIIDIKQAQLLSVDIDNEVNEYDPDKKERSKRCKTEAEGYMTMQSVMEDPWFHENALLIYTTPSHTEIQNRFRIVFLLPEIITDAKTYSDIATAFITKYDSDKSCKNFERMFFGHTNAECYIFGNQLTKSELEKIITRTKEEEKETKKYEALVRTSNEKLTDDQVADMLKYVPKQMDYCDWFKVVSAVGNYFDESTAVRLIENWSPDVKQGTAFKVKNRGTKPTIASVIYFAAQNGYDKRKLHSHHYVSDTGEILYDGDKTKKSKLIPADDDEDFSGKFDVIKFLKENKFEYDYMFWTEIPKLKNHNKEHPSMNKQDYSLKFNKSKLINFLHSKGYAKHWLDKNTSILVKMQDNIIEIVNEEQIIDVIKNEILVLTNRISTVFTKFDLLELFLNKIAEIGSKQFLRVLPAIPNNFIQDTKDTAYFFFKNFTVIITGNSHKTVSHKELPGMIWKEQIADRNINKVYIDLTDAEPNEEDIGQFERFIYKVCSPAAHSTQPREERIPDASRVESLTSAIGYLLHTYKNPDVTKAVIFCEEKIAKNEESNGRTGKGLTAKAISRMRNQTFLNGKQIDLNSQFLYQNVQPDTQNIYFDDIEKNFDFEKIFSDLTEGITIRSLFSKPFKIAYEKSPKIFLSTNKVLSNDSDSHTARKFEIEYSDYFDANYTPKTEFGNIFFEGGWADDSPEWDKFYSFMMGCTMYFLNNGLVKYVPVNLAERKMLAKVPEPFIEFAEEIIESLKSGEKIFKDKLYEDFTSKNKVYGPSGKFAITQIKTTRWFNDYLKFKEIELDEDVADTKNSRNKYWQVKKNYNMYEVQGEAF